MTAAQQASPAASTRRRGLPTAARPEVRVVATAKQRFDGVLDLAWTEPGQEVPADPALDDVLAAVQAAVAARGADVHGWWLDGGESMLRRDLPALARGMVALGISDLGLVTDGLALTQPKVAAALASVGVSRVRVRLHSSRSDAHDWLAGQPGAWKRAVKAVRVALAAGLVPEVECTVTRPTMPHLEESVELFARLGVKAVTLRRVTHRGPARANDVAVAARFGLLQPHLEAAVQIGTRRGVTMSVVGVPSLVSPGAKAHILERDAVQWVLPATAPWPFLAPRLALPPDDRGAPVDYVARFGRDEIDAGNNTIVKPAAREATPLAGGDVPPPGRAGRLPPTRLSYVRLAAKVPSMGGDPLFAVAPVPQVQRLRFVFVAPSRVADPVLGDLPGPPVAESTREARIRMVKCAQHKVPLLRIAGAGVMAHPAAAELLRELTRLEFDSIEVAGEASALNDMTDIQLRRLRGLTRIDVALYGPDAERHDAVMGRPGAFDATMEALDRLGNLVPRITLGCYAVLTGVADVADFAEAWDMGDLPGEPCFRLAPRGESLTALADAARALPEGPARDALAAVLPRAIYPSDTVVPARTATRAWGDVPSAWSEPSGSDRFGCYTGRFAAADAQQPGACPGVAVGWSLT